MTSPVVVDTNVLLVAEGQHPAASPQCVSDCAHRLHALKVNGGVVIDDAYLVLREYQRKIDPNRGRGVGAAFLKWLLQNQANVRKVERVSLTETAQDQFREFPDPALEPSFDPPDRKFPAVANAHPRKPPILQAVDCKWIDWWPALERTGIRVEFVCPDDICTYYRSKFPEKGEPRLP